MARGCQYVVVHKSKYLHERCCNQLPKCKVGLSIFELETFLTVGATASSTSCFGRTRALMGSRNHDEWRKKGSVMADDSKPVLYGVEGSTARITLNRPDKRNALNDVVIRDVKHALTEAAANDSVRVVLLSGNGQDFCSGADLSALQRISDASVSENMADARSLMELFVLIRQL